MDTKMKKYETDILVLTIKNNAFIYGFIQVYFGNKVVLREYDTDNYLIVDADTIINAEKR